MTRFWSFAFDLTAELGLKNNLYLGLMGLATFDEIPVQFYPELEKDASVQF